MKVMTYRMEDTEKWEIKFQKSDGLYRASFFIVYKIFGRTYWTVIFF